MPGSINGAERQPTQSIASIGTGRCICATGKDAFINLLKKGKNSPVDLFKQNPHQTDNAISLVEYEVQKNLPADFLQKNLSPQGNNIRMLIGVIYEDVQDSGNAEDIAKLDKVCKKLAEANGNENKEQKVEKELSDLVSKYIAGAFEKVVNRYIEHCRAAWIDYHQQRSVDTDGKVIFKECHDVCKSTVKHCVEGLKQRGLPLETMAQKLNFIVYSCAAISKTLTFYAAEPMTPEPKVPETLNPNPDGGADNQRVFIPTGPGQGGLTLNITSQGGSVGDITHSVGAANTAPADSNSAIVKHILDSGLTNVEKVGLITDLFYASIGGGSNFLGNLAGVQGYKQEQAIDTPQQNVARREIETQTPKPELKSIATRTEGAPETETVNHASPGPEPKVQQQKTIVVEQNSQNDSKASKTQDTQNTGTDNVDGIVLSEKKEPSGRTSSSNSDGIDTTNPLNLSSSTQADKPEALKQKNLSAFAHLDKNSGEETAEHDVEKNLTNSLIRPELALPLNTPVQSETSEPNRAPASIKTANPGVGSTDGGMLRKADEGVSRKSAADGFQPTQINPAAVNTPGNKSGNNDVYPTVRTVSLWDRSVEPMHFVPKKYRVDADEVARARLKLKPLDQSAIDAMKKEKIEQSKVKLEFQVMAEKFERLRKQSGTNHE